MNILIPFWSLNHFEYTYIPSMIDSLKLKGGNKISIKITYFQGEPKNEWKKYADFYSLRLPNPLIKSKITRFWLARRNLYHQIKKLNLNPEIIFCLSDTWANEFCRYLSMKVGVPYVIRLRGNFEKVRNANNIKGKRRRLLDNLDKKTLKKANKVIPNSENLVEDSIKWGVPPEKISAPIYNGVNTNLFRPIQVEQEKKFTIAYAGRLTPEKGVWRLLKTINDLPQFNFKIAGKKFVDINFPKNSEYIGLIPHNKMPYFYNKADLVILPSYTEGFANIILESYACGKTVLLSKEACPKNLKIFGSVTEYKSFKNEIERMSKLDLSKIGNEARNFILENYSWGKCALLILNILYNQV
jgi:glycosyltransferase involved in cell wall biosynthesis